jgi:acetyl-CoA carboxylase carboxyltransferase component
MNETDPTSHLRAARYAVTDAARTQAVEKQHKLGKLTARERTTSPYLVAPQVMQVREAEAHGAPCPGGASALHPPAGRHRNAHLALKQGQPMPVA